MPAFLITYDVIAAGKDRTPLHDEIKQLGAWWHCLECMWIIECEGTTESVLEALAPHIDAKDGLLVLQLHGNWSSLHLTDDCNQWLRDHVAP